MIGALVVAAALSFAAGPPPKSPRVQCGCPTPRILQRGPAVLDDAHTVSAWLHDDAQLELFQQDAVEKQKLLPVDDAPIDIASFESTVMRSSGESTSRFVKVKATGPLPERAYLGIMRKTDTAPHDVVAALSAAPSTPAPGAPGAPSTPVPGAPGAPPAPSSPGAPAAPSTPTSGAPPSNPPIASGPPVVKALWIAPLEDRERPGCGEWITHRIAFELADGSPVPEAFVVEDAHTGQSAVVDARFAGVFGLGRVDVCDQGVAFAVGSPTHITVKPVSSSFGVGDAWKFDSDGTGTTDVRRTLSPAGADKSRIEDPFPVPGEEDRRGPSMKTAAIAVMSTVVGGAGLVALIAWVIIPMRRRKMADIKCPSCGKAVPYDALDPKTDGFFCPSCGAAGFWKGKKGDVAEAKTL